MSCLVCAKHRGEGPLAGPVIWADDLLVVSHLPAGEDGLGFPGYLFVETRRHVAALDELTGREVAAVAVAAWRSARALRAALAPESVHSLIAGRRVAHFHQHVFARHRGTPDEVAWLDGHLRPGAPCVDLAGLCDRLRRDFRTFDHSGPE